MAADGTFPVAAVREGLAHPDFVLEDLSQLGEDAPGVSTLLNYLPVKAWDDDGIFIDTALGESYTDQTGAFTIETTHPASAAYLRVYTETAPFGAGAGSVTRATSVVEPVNYQAYYHEFSVPVGATLNATSPAAYSGSLVPPA